MSPSAREYLQHILDETTYIMSSATSLDKTKFVQDETLKRAYVRSIEVIIDSRAVCQVSMASAKPRFARTCKQAAIALTLPKPQPDLRSPYQG